MFNWAVTNELLAAKPRYGSMFDKPTASQKQKEKNLRELEHGERMFTADQVKQLLAATDGQMKAMILLGVNCGFGNSDCGTLPLKALDLDGGWVNYHRPKTGITRRCALWPETVAALRVVIAERKEPKNPANAELAFITYKNESWHKPDDRNPISAEMRKLLNALSIEGKRNFYAMRHTFETIGGESRDQVAVDHIMGHARDDMASVYRERISDERLKAVAEHVRKWVFSELTASK